VRGDPVEDGADRLLHACDVLAQEAADRRLHAVRGVRVERGLETLGLLQRAGPRAEGGVHRAVQDEPADALREELGVRRTELGAVRRAQVAHGPLAERRPQDVHVACRLDRRHVTGEGAGASAAARHEPLLAAPVRRDLSRRGG
jgi:hypothetical protein